MTTQARVGCDIPYMASAICSRPAILFHQRHNFVLLIPARSWKLGKVCTKVEYCVNTVRHGRFIMEEMSTLHSQNLAPVKQNHFKLDFNLARSFPLQNNLATQPLLYLFQRVTYRWFSNYCRLI